MKQYLNAQIPVPAVPGYPDTGYPGVYVFGYAYRYRGTRVPGYVAFFIATMLDLCIQLYCPRAGYPGMHTIFVLDTFGRESDVSGLVPTGTGYPDSRIPVCTSFLYDRGTFLTRKVPVDSTTICIIIPGTLVPTYNFFFCYVHYCLW